jgi:hypothetical protein
MFFIEIVRDRQTFHGGRAPQPIYGLQVNVHHLLRERLHLGIRSILLGRLPSGTAGWN